MNIMHSSYVKMTGNIYEVSEMKLSGIDRSIRCKMNDMVSASGTYIGSRRYLRPTDPAMKFGCTLGLIASLAVVALDLEEVLNLAHLPVFLRTLIRI